MRMELVPILCSEVSRVSISVRFFAVRSMKGGVKGHREDFQCFSVRRFEFSSIL